MVAQGLSRAPTDPGTGGRLPWIDATRGYSVAAVVLFHVVLWAYVDTGHPVTQPGLSLWSAANAALGSLRMPVLLAVSGLVLARRIRRGPLGGAMLMRSVRNYYLYVVWVGVYAIFYAVFTQTYLRHRIDGPRELAAQLVIPSTTLWYLLAIALYSLVLTAVRRWPVWLVLLLLTTMAAMAHAWTGTGQLWPRIPELFVFYAVGVYGAEILRGLAARARPWHVLVAGGAAVGVTGLGHFTQGHPVDALLYVPRGAAFLVLAVLTVSVAVRWRPVESLGVALGRRTIGIYLLHPLWIALLTIAVTGPARGALAAALSHPVGALLYPAVVAVVIVALGAPAPWVARKVGLGWLFALPARWDVALSAAPVPDPGSPAAVPLAPAPTPEAAAAPPSSVPEPALSAGPATSHERAHRRRHHVERPSRTPVARPRT
ncbi:MAG: acyltransferase [Cellulomonadaceae bacterium]|nr:acyltransferase [Cellulomonadaceae bacterium]